MFHLGKYIPQGVPDTFGFNGIDTSQCTGDTVALTHPGGISGLGSVVKFRWNGNGVELIGNTGGSASRQASGAECRSATASTCELSVARLCEQIYRVRLSLRDVTVGLVAGGDDILPSTSARHSPRRRRSMPMCVRAPDATSLIWC